MLSMLFNILLKLLDNSIKKEKLKSKNWEKSINAFSLGVYDWITGQSKNEWWNQQN